MKQNPAESEESGKKCELTKKEIRAVELNIEFVFPNLVEEMQNKTQ